MKNTKRTAAAQRPEPEPATAAPLPEAIAQLAYSYWEADGRPEDCDLHYWLRAERDLLPQRGDA